MKYDYRISSHKKRKFFRKIYIFTVLLFIVAAIGAGLIRLDTYLQNRRNTPDKTTTEQSTAYFASTTKIFRTKYFQFQTQDNWTEIPTESTDNKFVFRGQNKTLIEEELIVYVGEIPGDLSATRIVPVKSDDDGRLTATDISEHCNETVGGFKSNNKVVSYKGVKVNCDIDNTQYNVLVGLVGGTTKISLSRPDGSKAVYTLYYRNVKAVPDADELINIINSFQTR